MQKLAQLLEFGGSKSLDEIRQQVATGGCGTTGGAGKSSCGSAAGPADMPAEIWEKVKNHPCYSRRGAPPLRPHARGGGAGLQHPVQLLQPQIRLRQRIAAPAWSARS